jgi:single-strand DNA-binding protein
MNLVVLHGRLSRPVSERLLPSGDRMTVLDLTVPGTGDPPGRAESVPLAWFDAPTWAGQLDAGAELVVVGRVRRRFFRAGPSLQSRTEVVVDAGAPAGRPTRVKAVLAGAVAALTAETGSTAPPPSRRNGRRAPATFP